MAWRRDKGRVSRDAHNRHWARARPMSHQPYVAPEGIGASMPRVSRKTTTSLSPLRVFRFVITKGLSPLAVVRMRVVSTLKPHAPDPL